MGFKKVMVSAICSLPFAISYALPQISVPKTINCFVGQEFYQKLDFFYPEDGKGTAVYERSEYGVKEIVTFKNLTCNAWGTVEKYEPIQVFCTDKPTQCPITYPISIFSVMGLYWKSSTNQNGIYNTITYFDNPHGSLTGQRNSAIFDAFLGECLSTQ